ncbi:methyltransferase domain-containing protein [Modicisalibacter radicis]|uniref:methyltransferase domain-containing protein n=1 Tax=Halomonas sp. EAR18 TaxID=2518972 RepID=UPI00109C41BA|nr:methyltransferase domain-containing protein [Halomonas sp. EAR18]
MAMLGKKRPARAARSPSPSVATPSGAGASAEEGVVIERLSHEGRGVAHAADGKTLFVTGALPGERVEIAVHRRRKRFDEAHVRRWHERSPERASPPCPHYAQCGGCDLQHLALSAQRRHKREVLIEQLASQGIELAEPPALLAGAALGYRRRARLGVKLDSDGGVHLGFRARASHHLVDIGRCPILEGRLDALIAPLRERLASLDAPRHVGHLELLAGDRQRVVVVRQLRDNPADAHAWQAWGRAHDVHVAWLVGREAPVWRWLGEPAELGYGLTCGERRLSLNYAAGDFLQVNAEVNRLMVDTALDWLDLSGEERVLDLFAGVGNFSLPLALHAAEVTAVEGSPAMVERLADNARRNELTNVEARRADLAAPPRFEPSPDVVVLDPPREGAEAVCRALAASGVARVLYVACDPATLARDAARLVQAGYRISRAAVADMFVQTAHLESLVLFERGDRRDTQR